jgi:hypothetical protein
MSNALAGATSVDAASTSTCPATEADIADLTPMTVSQAHAVMQRHLRCMTATCAHRRTALTVLVGAGHYVLP